MRKVGYFFLSFVPLILATVIEYTAVFFMMGVSALFAVPGHPKGMNVYDYLYEIWMDTDFNIVIMMVFSLIGICGFGLWYYLRCDGEFFPDVKKTFHPVQFAAIALLIPGTQFISSIITSVLAEMVPSWMDYYEDLMESAGMDERLTVFLFCYSVILAPIGEELIFRGVTLRTARLALPFWAANILQAVLFGVFHGNVIQGCYAAFLGLFLGYVCERGGSIYYSIFFHFLFNLWGTVISEFLNFTSDIYIALLMFTGILVLFPIGMVLFHMGDKLKKQANSYPQALVR